MLEVRNLLHQVGQKQANLARFMGVSDATLSLIVNRNEWPRSINHEDLKSQMRGFLRDHGAPEKDLEKAFELVDKPKPKKPRKPRVHDAHDQEKEEPMLLRKQTLSQNARRAFGFARDPFGEVRCAEEVYLTGETRYVREAMRQVARHGGFMAVISESGGGKSTLRRDLVEWAHADQQITIIEPYVLGLEDTDKHGKTLKAAHLAESIMHAIAPYERVRRCPEARFRQLHEALIESHRAGRRHVLVIEEAHGLPIPTLKHLKRFFELEDGFNKLIGIILIGQPELGHKLDERNPRVREVVQRCEIVTLQPLDNDLEGYLKHRLALAGRNLADLMDLDAIEALRQKLTGRGHSVLYPLAIHNVLTCAFNEAAAIGIPQLTADLILEV